MHGKVIAKNTIFQFLTKIITSGLGFFITLLVIKEYGQVEYGNFAKITAYISFFYLFVDFGINAVYLRNERFLKHFKALLSLRIFLALLLMLFVLVFAIVSPHNEVKSTGFPPALWLGIFIYSLTILFQGVLQTIGAVLQKNLRYDISLWAGVVGSVAVGALSIVAFYIPLPLTYILFAYCVGNLLTIGVSFYLVKESFWPLEISLSFYKVILKESLPLGLMLLCNLVYFRFDIILLSFLKSPPDVAIYGYAYKYFEFLIAIPLFLSNAIYPFLLTRRNDTKLFFHFAKRYLGIFFIAGFLIMIPTIVFSPAIALLAHNFDASVEVLQILSYSLPLFFLTSILQWVLIAKHHQKFLLGAYFVSACVNIILNSIFIPQYGYMAAAVITGISECLVLVLLVLKFLRMLTEQ